MLFKINLTKKWGELYYVLNAILMAKTVPMQLSSLIFTEMFVHRNH